MVKDFYDEMTEQSQVKAEIVRKYFYAWAKIIIPQVKKRGGRKIAYLDLFAGRGRYEDGNKSTPLLVLEAAIRDQEMSQRLVTLFNEGDPDNARLLQEEINALPGIDQLRNKPKVQNHQIGEPVLNAIEKLTFLPPTLAFIDPWGYKGLSLRLVKAILRHWGCDCIFFFNYRRVNASLSNPVFTNNMNDLFGEARAEALRPVLESLSPEEREIAIVNELTLALQEIGGQYVLPFCFKTDSGHRTSHHLIFVSKNVLGYTIMKSIMGIQSSNNDQGVPSFVYNPASKHYQLLFELSRPLDDLVDLLLTRFAGQTLTVKRIFESHHVGRPYILRNYQDALRQLESDSRIITNPPATGRRKQHGKITFPETVQVTFPKRAQ